MTPSGSWVTRSSIAASAEILRGRSVFAVSARKKSMRGSTPRSSLRDCAMGLPTSLVRMRARDSLSVTTRSRNFAIAASRCFRETAAHRGCAARARSYFARTAFASSAASVAMVSPLAGLTTRSFFKPP